VRTLAGNRFLKKSYTAADFLKSLKFGFLLVTRLNSNFFSREVYIQVLTGDTLHAFKADN
jgi:hypothetical protein